MQTFLDNIWTDQAASNVRLEGVCPYNIAMAITTTAKKEEDVEEAIYLLHTLEKENAVLKDDLNATTMASSASAPSTVPPPEFIAATTTTGCDDALIAALTAQSATQAAQITKLLVALTEGGGDNGRRDSGKNAATAGVETASPTRSTNIARIASELSFMKHRNATSWRATQQPALTGGNRRSMASIDTRWGWTRELNKYLLN